MNEKLKFCWFESELNRMMMITKSVNRIMLQWIFFVGFMNNQSLKMTISDYQEVTHEL